MTSQARSVVVRLTAETAQYIREMQSAGKLSADAMTQAEQATARQSQALDQLGGTAGKVGLAAATGLALVGKAAMDWESQWAGVEKTVDGTASQMAALESEIRGLATSMPATHQEIAATAEAAGQLGVAREDVADFTKTMVMLGETTNLTSENAATSIAQFMNVMGTAAGDVDRIGNTIVDLGNKGASTEAQILDMAQRLSGAGALVGAAEGDVLAMASAMANLGIESELGGGAIQRVFTNIYEAAAEGEAGLSGFAKVSGMSARDFADQWANDPIRAFDAFLQGLGRIQDSGGNVVGTLDDLGISGTQNLQVMLRLAGAGDMLTTSLDQSNNAWSENSALTDEYAKRMGTTAAQVQIAWNNIKDAGIDAGAALLPVISEAAGMVSGLAGAFQSLPAPVKGSLTGLLALTAVLGSGAWAGAKIIGGIRDTRAALDALSTSGSRTSRALGGIGKAATGVGLAIAGAMVIDEFVTSVDRAPVGLEAMTAALLDVSAAAAGSSLPEEIDTLGASVDRLLDKKWNESTDDWLRGKLPLFGDAGDLKEAKADLDVLDQAMSRFVTTLGPTGAQDAFAGLADSMGWTSAQQERLLGMLPQYGEALVGAENETRLATDANAEYADATAGAGDAAGLSTGEINALAQSMRDQASAALAGFDAQTQWGAAVAAAREQAASGEKGINAMTESGRTNREMLSGVAAAWNDQSRAVKNNEARYAAARRTFIEIATAMTGSKAAARALADELMEVPRKVVAETAVETDASMDAVDRLQSRLSAYGLTVETAKAALNDVASGKIKTVQGLIDKYGLSKKQATALLRDEARGKLESILGLLNSVDGKVSTATIRTINETVNIVKNSVSGIFKASGGPIVGRGTKTSDSVPVMASNGEFMMSAAAVDHYGLETMFALNARRLAGGGPVAGPVTRPQYAWESSGVRTSGGAAMSPEDRLALLQAMKEVRDMARSLKADGKNRITGLERRIAQAELKQSRDALADARRAPLLRAREAGRGFDLEAGMSAADVREEYAEFRRVLREAGIDIPKNFDRLRTRSIALADRFEGVTAKIADTEEELESWRATAEDVSRSVAGIFDNDIYSTRRTGPDGIETSGGLAAVMLQLEADRNDTAERDQLLRSVAALGIDTASEAFRSLATGADMTTLRDLDTTAEARAFAAMFDGRASAQASAGQWASEAYTGQHIAKLEATLSRQDSTLQRLTSELQGYEQRLETATVRGTERGTQRGTERGAREGVRQGMADQQRVAAAKAKAR